MARYVRALIVNEGLTNLEISQRLQIPLRSTERYIFEVWKNDNQILAGHNSPEVVLTQTNVYIERSLKQRQALLDGIANNPEAPHKDRVAAHQVSGNMTLAIQQLYEQAPSSLARHHRDVFVMIREQQRGAAFDNNNSSSNELLLHQTAAPAVAKPSSSRLTYLGKTIGWREEKKKITLSASMRLLVVKPSKEEL